MKTSLALLLAAMVMPVQASMNADDIIKQVRERDDGSSYITDVTLKLISSDGDVRERNMLMLQKDMPEKEESAAMFFHSPADVRGVSFLMYNYPELQADPNEQWMYFPAFRKTRRIGANDKRGSFMGSTFSYADLDKISVVDYQSKLVGQEQILGRETYVIERQPKSQEVINKTGVYNVKIWIDKERMLVLQKHYFNAKNVMFKQQQAVDVQAIQGVWTIMRAVVENYELQKSSEMVFSNVKYNVELDDKHFSKHQLKKGLNSSDFAKFK